MLDDTTKQALRAVLTGDSRPWPAILDAGPRYIAEMRFLPGEAEKRRAVADAARALGFEVIEAKGLAKSQSVTDYLTLLIAGAAALEALMAVIRIPQNLRELRKLLRPYLSSASDLAPAIQLERVHTWLTEQYGKRWSYEPHHVTAKTINGLTVFLVQEKISGNRHLLAVQGDVVEELPAAWIKKDE